ncbi:MAG TPA: tetratricopeptide repeat protein [Terriglobia bacterium]|nr:tetratricopeptide repeat protein [Terriglobia bacterium]
MTCRYFRASRIGMAVFALLLAASTRTLGSYGIGGTLQNVPIERLIRNMEEIVARDAKDGVTRLNLARAHAMAFAQKSEPADEVRVLTNARGTALFFEPGQKAIPFNVRPAPDSSRAQLAAGHLARAIDLYREGLKLDPTNELARLGFAWCLDQAGEKGMAITAYRLIIQDAWAHEGTIGPAGQLARGQSTAVNAISSEAASYLIPLLDPQRDGDEIATLQERVRLLGVGPRSVSPIIIPLKDRLDVRDLMDMSAGVVFDADGSGVRKSWTWIKPSAGWLVYAPKDAEPVDSALRLFGNVTFWMFWDNGYQALATLDDDHNGVLSGAELNDLAVWRDTNTNGVADAGEVEPLAEWDIVSVNCRYEDTRERPDYTAFSPAGVTFKDGHTRPTYDVILYARRAATE